MKEPRSGRRLSHFVAETIAIVASILLAFWIDASWDTRGERLSERQVLLDLRTDFREAQEEFEDAEYAHAQRLASLEVLGGLAAGNIPPPSRDSIDVLLGWLMFFGTAQPQATTLASLEGAGELQVIRSDRLRALLARWDAFMEDAGETQLLAFESTIRDVHGWFRRGPPMPNFYDILPDVMMYSDPVEVLPYLTTVEFRNLVTQHYLLENSMSGEVSRLMATTSEILDELDAALADGG